MVGRAHALLDRPLRELSVVLVNDAVMSDLHRRYMDLPGPTDVLTFPLDETHTAGEIVICVPEARRRAKEHRIRIRDELLLYAIHGMLHLSGLDDRTRRGFTQMHRMEDQILTQLGVGPVFKVQPRARRGSTSARKGGRKRQ
jgi:probable rRNA maturation factor